VITFSSKVSVISFFRLFLSGAIVVLDGTLRVFCRFDNISLTITIVLRSSGTIVALHGTSRAVLISVLSWLVVACNVKI